MTEQRINPARDDVHSRSIAVQRTEDAVMQAAVDAVTDRINADVGFAAIGRNGPAGVFPITIANRIRDPRIVEVRVRPSLGLGGQVLVSGRPMFVTEYGSDPRISRDFVEVVSHGEGLHAVACVPVMGRSGVVALLYSGAHGTGTLGERAVDEMWKVAAYAEMGFAHVSALELEVEVERLRERERLATELHDSVAQRLFAIGAVARAASGTRDLEALLQQIDEIETTAADARRELRETLLQLNEDAEPVAFDIELDGELRLFERRTGATVRVTRRGSPRAMQHHVERLLTDTTLEGARNAVKHARARAIAVELSYEPEKVELAITQEEAGAPTVAAPDLATMPGTGAGLSLLRSRADRLGGTLELQRDRQGRVCLQLVVPVDAEAAV